MSVVIFSLPAMESIGQLSRIYIVVSALMMIVSFSLSIYDGKILKIRLLSIIVLSFSALLIVSTMMLDKRLSSVDYSLKDSVYDSVYAQSIGANADARVKMYGGTEIEKRYYLTIIPSALYYLSGVYELSRVLDRQDEQFYAYGGYLFSPYVKAWSVLSGKNYNMAEVELNLFPRSGVFSSFFGPLWVDFGWFGMGLMYFMGYIFTLVARHAKTGKFNLFPLYCYIVIVVFLFPVVNLLNSGNGFFVIHAFLAFAVFTSFKSSYDKLKIS